MKKHLFSLFFLLTITTLSAQVSINQDNSAPDPSAMLDVKSSDKGMLIPRMTSAERTAISNPANGLLVFDNTTNSFWYFNGAGWIELTAGADNLGDHTATENIQLNGNYLSGDGDNEGIAVDADGRVGIGTAVPQENLHVTGNIRMEDGNQQAGNVMTSDENGMGSWQSLGSLVAPALTPDFSCMALSGSISVGNEPALVEVSGNYAFVLEVTSRTFSAFDISNPAAPTLAGNIVLGQAPTWFAMSGNYAYVIDDESHDLMVVDVSNPASPLLVGSLALGDNPYRVAVSGNYAYVTGVFSSGGLKVVDVSNPGSPVLVGSLNLGISAAFVAASGSYVYVTDFTTDAFRVIDVSNPAGPVQVALLPIGNYHLDFAVSGNYAYIPIYTDGFFEVIDLHDPLNPVLVANPEICAGPTSISVSGNFAYFVDAITDDLKVVDVSNPGSPVVAGSLGIGPQPSSVAVSGNYAFVADRTSDDLKVIKLSCALPLAYDPSTGGFANANTDDADADPANELQSLSLSAGATLNISNGNSVNLSGINTDNQTLGLSGATLSISNGNSVDLAGIDTDTDNQTLGLSGTTLSIANGNNVNLSGINTDNQTLSLSGSNLSISNGNTIALPLSQTNALKDADNDTKILVEASPDEDVIHAYVKNVEGLQLNQNGLFAPGIFNIDGVAPVTGAGVRLMWVPALAALRVGEVTGTQWNSSNIGLHTSVLGGKNNFIPGGGSYGTIAGGTSNTVSGTGGFVGAGESNQASGEFAGIVGGLFNVASGYTSFIGTGQYNTASGQSSVVVGGEDNIAAGNMSTAAGYGNKAGSYGETTLGLFATNYTPASTTAFNASDRIFAIGNGTDVNSRSNALTILKSGNVGIGTATPSAKLQVNGGNIALSSGNFTLSGGNIALGGGWLSNDGGNEGVYVATNGRVGIGTTSPEAMLHVVGTKVPATGSGNYFVYSFGNNAPTQDIFVTNSVVGFFDGDVMASQSLISMGSIQWSDARAKRILRRSDSREDLDLLKRIQITDYQWIDQLEDHGRVNKKIIAQEVEQVLPDAVSRMRKAIPNVYAKAVKVDYNSADKVLTVYLDKAHDFSTGDKVRMFTDQGDLDAAEVLSVASPDIFTVSCEKAATSAFVYGKWVDDYRMVDYDAIAMLNVSATQELAKEVGALQQRIAELQAENTALKSAFEQRLQKLEASLQQPNNAAGK